MNDPVSIPLHDRSSFSLVSGLWKGSRSPLLPSAVLRSTNFRGDGLLDYSDIAELEVETRQFAERQLLPGDIIIERSGGGPKQPVGRVGFFEPPDARSYCTSNFTTAVRIVDKNKFDPRYVALFLHALYQSGATETLQRATTGIRNLDWNEYLKFEVPVLPIEDQRKLVRLVGAARSAYQTEDALIEALSEIKRTAMRALFARGFRGDALKETPIGLVPENWEVGRLDQYAVVVSTRMSYSELEKLTPAPEVKSTKVLGIKVSDMNRLGNEIEIHRAELEKHVTLATAQHRCAPPGTIIFPKRGAAIATNKKRISSEWTAFDPNVIGVVVREKLDSRYLYHWFQGFDLRMITEPGPTPQLNKKNLEPILISVPPTLDEQHEIAAILDALDHKTDLHKRKRKAFEDLFSALLHKMLVNQFRVADLDLAATLGKPPVEGVAA